MFFKREATAYNISPVEPNNNCVDFVNEPPFLALMNRTKWMLKATLRLSQTSVWFLRRFLFLVCHLPVFSTLSAA